MEDMGARLFSSPPRLNAAEPASVRIAGTGKMGIIAHNNMP